MFFFFFPTHRLAINRHIIKCLRVFTTNLANWSDSLVVTEHSASPLGKGWPSLSEMAVCCFEICIWFLLKLYTGIYHNLLTQLFVCYIHSSFLGKGLSVVGLFLTLSKRLLYLLFPSMIYFNGNLISCCSGGRKSHLIT